MAVIGIRVYDLRRALVKSAQESADYALLGGRRNACAVGRMLMRHGIASATIATGYRIE